MLGHQPEYGVERADSQRSVILHRYPLMGRRFGLENDVTARLVDNPIIPMLAKSLDQRAASEVSRQFHAQASTSSRSKCRRIERGAFSGASK